MSDFSPYKHNISTLTSTPTGDATSNINNNFKTVADAMDSTVSFRGGWSISTAYQVNDLVVTAGNAYICTTACTGQTPPNTNYWTPLSAAPTTVVQSGGNVGQVTLTPSSQFSIYKHNIATLTVTPTGDASIAINDNFLAIADYLDDVLTNSSTIPAAHVSGLGSAALVSTSSFDAAGSAAAVATSLATTTTSLASATSSQGSLLYSKSYFTDLSDFITTGTTPTITNGAIQLTGAPTFDSCTIQVKNLATADNQTDFTVLLQIVNTNPGSGYGFCIGRNSVNPWYSVSYCSQIDLSNSPNTMNFWPEDSGNATTHFTTLSSATTAVNGDILKVTLSQRDNVATVTAKNLTQNITDTYVETQSLQPNVTHWIANSAGYKFCGLGSTINVLSIRVESFQPHYPDVIAIGDSKTFGYAAGYADLRWVSRLPYKVASFGGDGDRTVEVLANIVRICAMHSRYAVLCIGRNDLGTVATATWQANYSTIVSSLKAAGTTVIHLLPLPEIGNDQSALKNYINSTFPNDGKVDVSGSWINSIHLSSDNVHPTAAGHGLIAQTIVASGLITSMGNV